MFAFTSSSAAALLSRTAASSASRASSWVRVRTSSAFFCLDLVAVLGHPLDRHPGAVAQRPHPADDRGVLLLDPAQVLVAREQVVEAVGLEHHREQVGVAGAVDADEPVAQHVQRAVQLLVSCSRRSFSRLRRCLDAAQLGDHDRLAVAQDRDLAGELVDAGVVVGELAREDALAVLLLLELGLGAGRAATAGPGRTRSPAPQAASRQSTAAATKAAGRRVRVSFPMRIVERAPSPDPSQPASRRNVRAFGFVGAPRFGGACKRYCVAATDAAEIGLGGLGGDRRGLEQAVAVLGHLHPRDHQALDLGRALEQLVDLRVAEPLLQRALRGGGERADEVHQRAGRPDRDLARLQLRHRALPAGQRDPVAAHPRGALDEQAGRLDLGRDLGEHLLDALALQRRRGRRSSSRRGRARARRPASVSSSR